MPKLKVSLVDLTTLRSNPPLNMSLREAAAYLGIYERKLWGETSAGRVKAARIGSRLIYPKAELDRYVSLLIAAA